MMCHYLSNGFCHSGQSLQGVKSDIKATVYDCELTNATAMWTWAEEDIWRADLFARSNSGKNDVDFKREHGLPNFDFRLKLVVSVRLDVDSSYTL